jgi:F-type H+-transporting ATPase subunit beta
MDSTDGLSRGYEVVGTGYPIQMPIGADVYGRLFNVIGDAIEENLPKTGENGMSIHRQALNSKIYQLHLKFYSQVLK